MFLILLTLAAYVIALSTFSTWAYKTGKKQGVIEGTRETNARWDVRSRQKQLEIKCLCGHGPNMHGPQNGSCDQTIEWEMRGPGGLWTQRVKCRCKRYTGPEFLPTFIDKLELEMRK